ncbi:MAG: LytTR family DNA-binding domain-containing protein, partial [Bacteroidota bacterium]
MKTNTSTILAFASHDTYQMVLPCTIAYLASAGNYVRIHRTKGPDVLVSKNLKAIESILPPDMFVRIHKQYVVNIYQI